MKSKVVLLLFAIMMFFSATLIGQIRIVSGFKDATYYDMAKDIQKISSLTIDVVSTDGALQNFNMLINNECHIAFLQNDVLYYEKETGSKGKSKVDDIKILLPLGYEEIHLIILKNSSIKTFEDLKGKKVAVGSKNSGTYITSKYIKTLSKIKWKDVEIGFNDALEALITGDVDAFFFVGSAPVNKLVEIPDKIKDQIKMIPVTNSKLDKYYSLLTVKAGTYSWLSEDVTTYGVSCVLATNAKDESETKIGWLKTILEEIRTSYDQLVSEGHAQWKEVDFNFENLNWQIHPLSIEIFQLKK